MMMRKGEGNFAKGAKDDDFQTALITLEWILKCKENLKVNFCQGSVLSLLFSGALLFSSTLSLIYDKLSKRTFSEYENEFIRSSKLSFHAMMMTNKKLTK